MPKSCVIKVPQGRTLQADRRTDSSCNLLRQSPRYLAYNWGWIPMNMSVPSINVQWNRLLQHEAESVQLLFCHLVFFLHLSLVSTVSTCNILRPRSSIRPFRWDCLKGPKSTSSFTWSAMHRMRARLWCGARVRSWNTDHTIQNIARHSHTHRYVMIHNDIYIYISSIYYTVCIYHVKRVKAFAFDDASSPNEDSDSEVSSESLVKLVLAILLRTKDKLRVLCGMNSGRTGRVHRNSEASVYEYRIIQTYLLLSAYCKTVYCKWYDSCGFSSHVLLWERIKCCCGAKRLSPSRDSWRRPSSQTERKQPK